MACTLYLLNRKCFYKTRDSVTSLTLCSETLGVVEKLVYLGSGLSSGGGVADKTSLRKLRRAYGNLVYHRHCHNVNLDVKNRVYNLSVGAILFLAF